MEGSPDLPVSHMELEVQLPHIAACMGTDGRLKACSTVIKAHIFHACLSFSELSKYPVCFTQPGGPAAAVQGRAAK